MLAEVFLEAKLLGSLVMAEAARRAYGEDSIYFDHTGVCRDAGRHRHCQGRWRGVVSLGSNADGRRIRKKVSGRTKSDVKAKLKKLHDELDSGIKSSGAYTVEKTVSAWLEDGLDGRSAKTVSTNREVLDPLVALIGKARCGISRQPMFDLRSRSWPPRGPPGQLPSRTQRLHGR